MARKKKSLKEEYTDGLRRLAFGKIQDAVKLLYLDDETILSQLKNLELINVSEIKRPKGGGMEIKFFDRIKALEKLREIESGTSQNAPAFYRALDEGAKSVWGDSSGDTEE